MKKVIAIMLSMVMALSVSPGYFAAVPETRQATSYDVTGAIDLQLTATGDAVNAYAASLMKNFENVNISYSGTVHQESAKAAQLYLDMTVVSGIFNIPVKMWMDIDMSDLDDLTYKLVLEPPAILTGTIGPEYTDKQYMLYDYTYTMNQLPEAASNVSAESLKQYLEMGKMFTDVLKAKTNELITAVPMPESSYRITINDTQAAQLIMTCVEAYIDYLTENSKGMFDHLLENGYIDASALSEMTVQVEQTFAQMKQEIPKVSQIVNQLELFPENDIVYDFTLDENNYVTHEEGSMSLALNFNDIAKAVLAVYPERAVNSVNSDVYFTADIHFTTDYTNLDTAETISFPVLTDSNSYNVYEEQDRLLAGLQEQISDWDDYNLITVRYNEESIEFQDSQPEIIKGRTMVPADSVFRTLGGNLTYIVVDGVQTVNGTLGSDTITLSIGSDTAYVNNVAVKLDVPAYINEDDRTMVPLRFIAENLGLAIEYENENGTTVSLYTSDFLNGSADSGTDQMMRFDAGHVAPEGALAAWFARGLVLFQ